MLYGVPLSDSRGQRVLHPTREQYVALARTLLDETFTTCSDLTAVDYLQFMERSLPQGVTAERFEVVVNLLSIERRERIRIRVQVPADDPSVPTLFDLYPGTEAMEREVYDMFGITFTDHPDLTRILMPEDWEGHPLRKDYEQGRIPVQFSGDFAPRGGQA
ncbi:MAG: NADH-quinone oxidoreductase subunit C [Ilumatobacter sp.]|nr:NADH-quinone oxidoreductase subunit C [Ilumatobacter sp.]